MDTNIWIVNRRSSCRRYYFLAGLLFTQKRRSQQLQSRFGPEYDRAVRQ